MTKPEEVAELVKTLRDTMLLIPMKNGAQCVTQVGVFAADLIESQQATITELERYQAACEMYLVLDDCRECKELVLDGYICPSCGKDNSIPDDAALKEKTDD